MSDRRLLVLAVAIALIVVGLLALQFPVYLNDFDIWGAQIKCGNGFSAEPLQASIADHHADAAHSGTAFTDRCQNALLVRRVWAIGTTALGGAMLAWVVIPWLKEKRPED